MGGNSFICSCCCSSLLFHIILFNINLDSFSDHKNTVTCCRFSPQTYRFCSTSLDLASRVVDIRNYRDDIEPHVVLSFKLVANHSITLPTYSTYFVPICIHSMLYSLFGIFTNHQVKVFSVLFDSIKKPLGVDLLAIS